ncbi:MAG: YicC/YloC family endoribonuclease, partial [Pseudomonadota bacterium]
TLFRLPEQFRGLEPVIRERFRKRIQRGKIECALRFSFNEGNVSGVTVNETLASQIINAVDWVKQNGADGPVNPMDILRWPGVTSSEEADMDVIQKDMLEGFETALEEFIQSRKSEGANMVSLLQTRMTGIVEQVAIVKEGMPAVLDWQRERILAKFEDAKIDLEEGRVEQEMVILAQKSDVSEELDRLESHVDECRKVLKKGGAVGRRLDFMMQEFNREANTLGSKSISKDITQAAVELKVLIEQMREQVQNIE